MYSDLWKALTREVGDRSSGPSGRTWNSCLMLRSRSLVTLDWPMARADRYRNLYPLLLIWVKSWATPDCDQSRPMMGRICPKTSDLRKNANVLNTWWKIWHHLVYSGISFTSNLLCNCSINVRNHNFIVIVPQVYVWHTPCRPLILCRNRKRYIILAFMQVQFFL